MDNQSRSSTHVVIVMGLFFVGLAFRLIRLGVLPLTNLEAAHALQALAISRGEQTLFEGVHAYVGLTGLPFYLFSSSNFMARFWAAISGALIVFIPMLFSKQIGQRGAILASLILAISPEMVALSRIIGSPMMAFVFAMLGTGFWLGRKPILAGICLGLGLMSGESFWVGIVILCASMVVSEKLFGLQGVIGRQPGDGKRSSWVRFAISLVITLLTVGTGFFMAPAGLSGIFSGLFSFLLAFRKLDLASSYLIPLALLAYGMGAVIFGLWGGIRGILIKSKLDMFLIVWAGLGLVFITLYSGSGAPDMVWVTFPLWILTARVVASAWRKPNSSNLVVAVTAVMVVVVAAFMAFSMRAVVTPGLSQSQQINYLIALAGGAVLLVAIVLLVSYGWAEDIAKAGLLLGVGLVMFAGMISVSVNATGIGPEIPYELFYPDEAVLETEWLQVTIDRTLVWNSRGFEDVDLVVAGLESPGLHWALHAYDPLNFLPFIPPQSQPGILITKADVIPEISNSYQGQSLVWAREVAWQELTPKQYLTWLVSRDVPTTPLELILWVRTDLMPGGQVLE